MIEVRACLAPRGCRKDRAPSPPDLPLGQCAPSPVAWPPISPKLSWTDADMLAVARFAELVGAGSVRRWRVREWRTVTAVLERSITATGHDVFLLGAAAPILRWALLEIAAEGMRELTVGRR